MLNKLWMKLKELCSKLKLISIPSLSPFQTTSPFADCMLFTFDNLYPLIDKTYCGFPSADSDVRIIDMLPFEDYTNILYSSFKQLYTLHEDKDSSCSIRSVFSKFLSELPALKLYTENTKEKIFYKESPFKNISYFHTLDELFVYYSTYCLKGKGKDFITFIEENFLPSPYYVLVDSYHNESLVYRCFNRLTQRKDFFLIDFNTGN